MERREHRLSELALPLAVAGVPLSGRRAVVPPSIGGAAPVSLAVPLGGT